MTPKQQVLKVYPGAECKITWIDPGKEELMCVITVGSIELSDYITLEGAAWADAARRLKEQDK